MLVFNVTLKPFYKLILLNALIIASTENWKIVKKIFVKLALKHACIALDLMLLIIAQNAMKGHSFLIYHLLDLVKTSVFKTVECISMKIIRPKAVINAIYLVKRALV